MKKRGSRFDEEFEVGAMMMMMIDQLDEVGVLNGGVGVVAVMLSTISFL